MSSPTDSILVRLNSALEADGDFPTRARVITEIRRLTEDPLTPVDKLVRVILSDPSLATRIIHIVNSVYHGRGKPVETLSQAVVHLGLKSIYNLCANFVVMQRFTPLVKNGSAFYQSFLLSMITANLSSLLDSVQNSKDSNKEEEGYLTGSLFTLDPLLLAYYFPKLFSETAKRVERKRITLYQSIEEILGVPAVGISLGVVDALTVPDFYKDLIIESYSLYVSDECMDYSKVKSSACSVTTAALIAEIILEEKESTTLAKKIETIAKNFGFDYQKVMECLRKLPLVIGQQSDLLGIEVMELPTPFFKLLKGERQTTAELKVLSEEESPLTPYLEQLESAIAESETLGSVIATVMEALTFAMDFERVVYLESDIERSCLNAKLGLGDKLQNFDDIKVLVQEDCISESVDLKAFAGSSVETFGDPLFSDGWPFAALPVGYEDRTLGVIYADLVDSKNGPLAPNQLAALSILADILDKAIQKNRV